MTKHELITRIADVPDDAVVKIGVMYMNGDAGEGDFYSVDDIMDDDHFCIITCTAQADVVAKLIS